MDWMKILATLFEIVVYPVISLLGIYLIFLVSTKINELKTTTDNALAHKYLDMLNHTISTCVLATTQTYVESLKKQNAFDTDAQKIAFKQTFDAVMNVLNDEAIYYLQNSVGDLETYITNRIEAEVNYNKN